MNEKVLKDLIKTRNVLRRKFRSIKLGEADAHDQLKKSFKPITEPLRDFINISKNGNTKIEKKKIKNEAKDVMGAINKNLNTELNTNIPKKLVEDTSLDASTSEEYDDADFHSQPISENQHSQMNFDNLSYLEQINELDTLYGPHKDLNNEWKFGDSTIKFKEDKIQVGNQIWALTPGLFSLMFHKKPKNYDKYELDIYKKLLFNTNAFKKGFSSDGHIRGTRAYKYRNIIEKLIKPTKPPTTTQSSASPLSSKANILKESHMGSGLMNLNPHKANYIYWDDPNELIDRLRLLLASQAAGHNNHNNEIVSIIEELYEADIIEK